MKPPSEIERFIFAHINANPQVISKLVAERFSITRQAANKRLARLVRQGLLVARGRTRDRWYRLAVLRRVHRVAPLTWGLDERGLWHDHVAPLLGDVPRNVQDICSYGFIKMVNNAKDHSTSTTVTIDAEVTAAAVTLIVADEGTGVFRRIMEMMQLADERQAAAALARGKLTTDAERHRGEGIFFCSRLFDRFSLGSGRITLRVEDGEDFRIEEAPESLAGTRVAMEIAADAPHTTTDVLERGLHAPLPAVRHLPAGTSDDVQHMIRRAEATRGN